MIATATTDRWVPMHTIKEGDVIMLTHERYVVELVEKLNHATRLILLPECGGNFSFDDYIDNPNVVLLGSKRQQVQLCTD